MRRFVVAELDRIQADGLYKQERILTTRQGAQVGVAGGARVLNLCANNYLGLSGHPALLAAAHAAIERWGYGLSSVRFICGTQSVHAELEARLSAFLGTDDTVLYSSCFDANGGLFEALLGEQDAIISDTLNHASIIDGIRLCKARRLRYRNGDMADLKARLVEAADARHRLIATDGVFSMDGTLARLDAICALAEEHDALVMVDDSHATGIVGQSGRGTHEYYGVMGRVDLITGTLGKALGGASGGFTSGRKELIALLRQRSRPYLFSNALCPIVAHTTLTALDLLSASTELRDRLERNTQVLRYGLSERGFDIVPGQHPIVPIVVGDARLAQEMAARLFVRGVYVVGFSYPVVPRDKARIRLQVSAEHSEDDLRFAIEAISAVRAELHV